MLDGILPIYKEHGLTSHDVVFKARKILQMKKIGHAGTLDPDVDGVLLLLLGGATKVSDYAMDLGKVYLAEVCLGIKTTTEDISGEVIAEEKVFDINETQIKEVLENFVGEIVQTPPIYSAVKVNGKKLYEYARKGQFDVKIPSRKVTIYSMDFVDESFRTDDGKIYFKIKVSCSKGTYIRTLATQIGEKLGVPSTMSSLTRVATGKITINNCITLDDLAKFVEQNDVEKVLLPKEYTLEKYQFVELPEYRAKQVMNGLRFRKNQFPQYDFSKGIVFTYKQKAIAVYYLKNEDDELLSVKTTFPMIIGE